MKSAEIIKLALQNVISRGVEFVSRTSDEATGGGRRGVEGHSTLFRYITQFYRPQA